MQPLFEAAAVLLVLFLILRLSLHARRDPVRLRAGVLVLNVATGALVSWAAALAVRQAARPAPLDPPGAVPDITGFEALGAALLAVLPFCAVVLGAFLGHRLFGALWRHLLRRGPARARAWLRRSQFLACAAAAALVVRHFLP